ncbi:MAG: exosortase B [Burkholderiales bacterium]
MSATFDAKPRPGAGWLPWLPVAAGLLALYVPVFYEFANGHWQSDDHAHGPIILAVIVWLVWRERGALLAPLSRPALIPGIALLVLGLLVYVVGRSQDITIFEAGALAPILAGTLLAMRGWAGLRAFWFPILFVAFLVPLPGMFVDALTGPLKREVSEIAEQLLYAAGYPVARSGVMLTVGQYQLLVADACSGLNSMFSLSALGLLYLYLMQRKSWLHNTIMIASILPIAFVANIVRVMTLVLVTYHLGDEAGQGFLHGAAGIVLLLVALSILLALDAILARLLRARHSA